MTQFWVPWNPDWFESKMTLSPAGEAWAWVQERVTSLVTHFSADTIAKSNPEILWDVLKREGIWKEIANDIWVDESLVSFNTIPNLLSWVDAESHPRWDIFVIRIWDVNSQDAIHIWMNNYDALEDWQITHFIQIWLLDKTCMRKSDFEKLKWFTEWEWWNNSQRRRFFRFVLWMKDGDYICWDYLNDTQVAVARVWKNISFSDSNNLQGLNMRWNREPAIV
jgi:hypothetical protein